MEVDPVAIHLPDFDRGVFDGGTGSVENFAAEVGDLTDGGGCRIFDQDEVVVLVKGELIGIERSLGEIGGDLEEVLIGARFNEAVEFFGEEGGGGSGGEGLEQFAAGWGSGEEVHGLVYDMSCEVLIRF